MTARLVPAAAALRRHWLAWLPAAAVALALAAFAVRAYHGLFLLEFGDESEKFVAATLIRHGMRLYRDFFANHGPLAFALVWVSTGIFGDGNFSYARLVNVVLALAAAAAIAASPLMSIAPVPRRFAARCWAVALFLGPLSALWIMHTLHMVIYHALIGFLIAIALAQLILPALAGLRIGRGGAAVAGAALAWGVFAAYSFALPAALAVLAVTLALAGTGGRAEVRRVAGPVLAGAAGGAAPVALWITVYADWPGLVIYHFYFNQFIYVHYNYFDPWTLLYSAAKFSLGPEGRIHTLALLLAAAGLVLAWRGGPGRLARLAALAMTALVILSLDPRGSIYFHDASLIVAAVATLAATLGPQIAAATGLAQKALLAAAGAVVITAELVARTAYLSPWDMRRGEAFANHLGADPADPTVRLVDRIADRGEPILALAFAPLLYLMADRPPASGYYFYLPMQAEYDRNPVAGYAIDLCGDTQRRRPPVILLYPSPSPSWVFGDYSPCMAAILAHDYVLSDENPVVWIRRDRLR